jgi:sarcosine oxidase, subunit beta
VSTHYDLIVIGGGVIGCSVAFHAAKLGASVLLLERSGLAEGTTAQSSGILRTHYSIKENVELAHHSYSAFADFAAYLEDAEADAGFNRCGYLIVADESKSAAVSAAIAQQASMGIAAQLISATEAKERLPLLNTDALSVFGYEPNAGYADPYLVATHFARAARRLGATIHLGATVQSLITQGSRVLGVRSNQGDFSSQCVVSAANVWSNRLLAQLHLPGAFPLAAERHEVIALEAPLPYLPTYPVFKDMTSQGMLYARCYGRTQLLVSKGIEGKPADPDEQQADVPLDLVAEIGEGIACHLPTFAEAHLAASWTGLYDVTPDWNPVLGPLPGWDGLQVGFGFSGHGFKLSPMVGLLLAQSALGVPPQLSLQPYRYARFSEGQLFHGQYGAGAVS